MKAIGVGSSLDGDVLRGLGDTHDLVEEIISVETKAFSHRVGSRPEVRGHLSVHDRDADRIQATGLGEVPPAQESGAHGLSLLL